MICYNNFPADYVFWQGMALHEMGNIALSKKNSIPLLISQNLITRFLCF